MLGSAEGQKPPSASGSGLPVYEEEVEEVAKEEFIIGDEDDDEDEKVDVDAVPTPDSPPPYYEEGDVVVPAEKAEGGDRAQCSIHYIKPADTLAGLSLHYRCDVSVSSFHDPTIDATKIDHMFLTREHFYVG